MFVINNRKIFFAISGILVLVSLIFTFSYGLNVGIDFTGGTLIEVDYGDAEMVEISELGETISGAGFENVVLQPTGENGLILRTGSLTEEEGQQVLGILGSEVEVERFTNIGPTIGSELKRKAYVAIAIVLALIILFVAWAFRKSNKQISSWTFGLVAIIALLHDIIIPVGAFTILGHFFGGFEINALFITALLAILGYSVNDTIVVFDRTRENLSLSKGKQFDQVVGESLNQTVARSINTSLTTLVVLLALYFFGGQSTHDFTLVLIFGVIAGTYSSIFLASPLLVVFEKFKKK